MTNGNIADIGTDFNNYVPRWRPAYPSDGTLIDNGYEPVAVNGKRALGKEWSTRPNTDEAIAAERKALPGATNTGLRTGRVSGVDIDIIPADHVAAFKTLAADILGFSSFERIGSKGAMLCYQNATPIGKITVAGTDADGARRKIEILGTGQQFVAYGTHPDTGNDYTWPNAGSEPGEAAWWELPTVTPEKLREFAARAAALLRDLGYSDVAISDRGDKRTAREARRRQDKAPVPVEQLQEILGYIDPGCERGAWIGVLGGIQATNLRDVPEDEMDEHLLEIAQAWSRADYQKGPPPANWINEKDVEDVYWSLNSDKPGGTTFGTLYHQARENGYAKLALGESAEARYGDAEWARNVALPSGWTPEAAALDDDPASWPEPMDLFGVIAPEPQLTRGMLPDSPAIEYAFDVAERMGVHPTVTVPAMLAACAAAIDDRFKVQRKVSDTGHVERAHANFWLVAESGAGKTPAITEMLRPLKDAEDRWAKEYGVAMSEYELRLRVYKDQETAYREQLKKDPLHIPEPPVAPVKPTWRKVIIEEATTEGVVRALEENPRGVLSHQDEIAGFLGSFDAYRSGRTGKDRAFWLQTDNGGPYTVDRVGGRIRVPNLSVSFIGGIQPDRLRQLAPHLTTDGFIQRGFVIRMPQAPCEEVDRAVNEDARTAYFKLIGDLLDLEPSLPVEPIILDWEAHGCRAAIEAVAAAYMALPTTPEPLKQHLSKWKGKTARILLLFHTIECASRGEPVGPEVQVETARRVEAFMLRFVLPHAIGFYTEFFRGADKSAEDGRWIAGHILADGKAEITKREITRAYRGAQDDEHRLIAAMRQLTQAGWLSEAQEVGASVRWTVNPEVHKLFAARGATEKTQRQEARARIERAAAVVRGVNTVSGNGHIEDK